MNAYKIKIQFTVVLFELYEFSNAGNIQVESEPINVETIRLHIQYVCLRMVIDEGVGSPRISHCLHTDECKVTCYRP